MMALGVSGSHIASHPQGGRTSLRAWRNWRPHISSPGSDSVSDQTELSALAKPEHGVVDEGKGATGFEVLTLECVAHCGAEIVLDLRWACRRVDLLGYWTCVNSEEGVVREHHDFAVNPRLTQFCSPAIDDHGMETFQDELTITILKSGGEILDELLHRLRFSGEG